MSEIILTGHKIKKKNKNKKNKENKKKKKKKQKKKKNKKRKQNNNKKKKKKKKKSMYFASQFNRIPIKAKQSFKTMLSALPFRELLKLHIYDSFLTLTPLYFDFLGSI